MRIRHLDIVGVLIGACFVGYFAFTVIERPALHDPHPILARL